MCAQVLDELLPVLNLPSVSPGANMPKAALPPLTSTFEIDGISLPDVFDTADASAIENETDVLFRAKGMSVGVALGLHPDLATTDTNGLGWELSYKYTRNATQHNAELCTPHDYWPAVYDTLVLQGL